MKWTTGERKGNVIECTGTWTSPSSVNNFRAALSKLHIINNPSTRGHYIEPCDSCLELPNLGFDLHKLNPEIRHRGNVTTDTKFQDSITLMNNYCKEWYEKRQTIPLLPNEI